MEHAAVQSGIESHAKLAVVVVAQGNKAEGLKARALQLAGGREHFRHPVDGTGAGMESDFDEIAGGKLLLDLKQSAGNGDGLEFCARSLATFRMNCSGNGSVELESGRTPVGVGLGEVSHSQWNYAIGRAAGADYQSTCTRAYA